MVGLLKVVNRVGILSLVEATSCKSTIDPIASLRAGSWGDMERPCVVVEYLDILMDCTEREIFRSSLHPQTQLLMVRA